MTTAHKEERPDSQVMTGCGAENVTNQEDAAQVYGESGSGSGSGADVKRVARIQARAALIGATAIPSTSDDGKPTVLLNRWAFTRELSLDDAEALLDRMGAPA